MKIIFIKDKASSSSICVSKEKLWLGGFLCLFVVPVLFGVMAYMVVAKMDRINNPFVDPEYRIAVEGSVELQKSEIQRTRDYVRDHMDALGRKIGSLQAQVSRINAVELRIADQTGIDLTSFDFAQDPPVGGAETEADSEQIDIENAITAIEQELDTRESEIAVVDFLLSNKQLQARQTPAGWPVEGGWISSGFGTRMHPMTGGKHFHRGVDIPGKEGANVLAVADGVVIRSERKANYGWLVEIDHGDGYTTLYSHNKQNLVEVGETVSKGLPIARLGSTGRSTGPHVHFEVIKQGRAINPIKYLYKKA